MATWTVFEANLADGKPMRAFLAEQDGLLWASSLFDDVHRKSIDELEFRLGPGTHRRHTTPLLAEAVRQVEGYFRGDLQSFAVPLEWRGTPFQNRVWQALTRVPYAAVQSYGDIADSIGAFGAARAVGGANGRNHLPLFVPCHRVIAAGGKIGGYNGGLGLKRRLLAHEASVAGVSLAPALL